MPQVTEGHKLLSQTNMAEGERTNTAGGGVCVWGGASARGQFQRRALHVGWGGRTQLVMALEPSVVCELLSQGERKLSLEVVHLVE